MKTAHLFITGDVQGVGYRQFLKSLAKKYQINGWIRNLSDGRVEAMLQGNEQDIIVLIEQCAKGPFLAVVKDIATTWIESDETYSAFDILPTM